MLSVVVPVYNSSAELRQCLAGLATSKFDDFDVLVVDDGSTEPIEAIVNEHGFRYMRIDGPSGPARARNRGVLTVEGEYVVFIDADVIVHEDTLERFADALKSDSDVVGVIGTYDDDPAHPSFLSQYKNIFHHYVHQSAHGDVSTFWSGCGAMRRDVFIEFGGFDEKRYRRPAIEDIELGTWVSAAGHRLILDSRVKCKHLKQWTVKNLLKTDIFDRAIPWTRLMLRARDLPDTLNVSSSQRIYVAMMGLAVVALFAMFWQPYAWIISASIVTVVSLCNARFYQYFAQRQGLWFALRVVPLHWIYLLYCGFGFFWANLQHHLEGRPTSTAAELKPLQ